MRRPELAALVARLGPDYPVAGTPVEQRDPYTNEPLPPQPPVKLIDTPDGSSYFSATPNPCRGGKMPPLYAFKDEHGIGFFTGKAKEGDRTPDVALKSQIAMYARRKHQIRETGTFPGSATQEELKQNPNEHLETPLMTPDEIATTITPSTPENNHDA